MLTEIDALDWNASHSKETQRHAVKSLETGNIILLPKLKFTLEPHEIKFLSPTYSNLKAKNISYNRANDSLNGTHCSEEDYPLLKAMMNRFYESARQLIQQVFPPYANALQVGRTSFRPVEIAGRVTSYRKDDTRLHVDAFPSTPNQGRRILRVFSNINPDGLDRIWRAGEPFQEVAQRFLPGISKPFRAKASILKALKITKSYRTEYDHIMLHIHDRMKADLQYQATASQSEIRFAPNTSWIVQTDHVSHAAMSGQHVLEQTFYLPVSAMIEPAYSPLRTLEKLVGRKLI